MVESTNQVNCLPNTNQVTMPNEHVLVAQPRSPHGGVTNIFARQGNSNVANDVHDG